MDNKLLVACDGACSGNGNPNAKGGWGVVARLSGEEHVFSGSKTPTTNNEMELTGFLVALQYIGEYLGNVNSGQAEAISSAIVYCDSAYIVDCIRDGWYRKWEKNGWRTSSKEPVKNKALWEQLLREYRALNTQALACGTSFEIRKIKGHIRGTEAEKWRAKYNARYGCSMSVEDFAEATALNDVADKLAVEAGK